MKSSLLLATPVFMLACAPLDQPIAHPPLHEPGLRGTPFRDSPIYGPPMTEPGYLQTVTHRTNPNQSSLIGLPLGAAQAEAERAKLPHRVIERDGQALPRTMDYRPERLNFNVERGRVINVTRG
ncbi:MAG: hypothetical protein WED15_02360 [Akkermansiaceae bacterium]